MKSTLAIIAIDLLKALFLNSMQKNTALSTILTNLQIEEKTTAKNSSEEQFQLVVDFIDHLIQNDFNRLLTILYRVDISEQKLKAALAQNKDTNINSAFIIANLLLEREEEKIRSRAKYRP